jgi:hypothetical protein
MLHLSIFALPYIGASVLYGLYFITSSVLFRGRNFWGKFQEAAANRSKAVKLHIIATRLFFVCEQF